MTYAEIKDGKVVNIIVANAGYGGAPGKVFVPGEGASIGDSYDGVSFTPPPSPEASVPFADFVRAESDRRLDAGFLLDDGTRFRCDDGTRSMLAGFQSLPDDQLPLTFVTAAGRLFTLSTRAEIDAIATQVAIFVAQMLAASSVLQAGPEVDFTDDVHWPAGSAGA